MSFDIRNTLVLAADILATYFTVKTVLSIFLHEINGKFNSQPQLYLIVMIVIIARLSSEFYYMHFLYSVLSIFPHEINGKFNSQPQLYLIVIIARLLCEFYYMHFLYSVVVTRSTGIL